MAESRTRTTLSDQLAVQDSSHLRDLLKVREEDTDGAAIGVRRESHSLGAALASEKNGSSRSLFDMIRTEEGPSDSSSSAGAGGWRGGFKDQLRVQAADTAWTETPPPGVSVTPTPYRAPSLARTLSVRPPETPAAAAAPESPPPPQSPAAPVEPVRISLMALLAQTDSYGGEDGEESPAGGEEEEDDGEEDDGGGGGELQCCVCMVRHKGAAFIPCGHTFCRLCSRELWVSRGNCPLCNGYILEILDIF